MKLPFFKRLFSQNQVNATTQLRAEEIPQKEVDNLIDAAVEEAIVEDYINSSLNESRKVLKEAHEEILRESIKTNLDFKVVKEINGSRFEVNKQNRIARITWINSVNLSTARELLTMGADSVEFKGYKTLILDRSELIEFDTEVRVWIKGFLKNRAKKIAKMVDKVAVVKPNSAKGSIFSNFIGSAISLVIPNLEMQNFKNVDEAIEWLT